MRNTARQIQAITVVLEDAKFTNKDIFLTYIDFKNAFGSINQPRLFVIMEDIGYPPNVIELVGNIYAESTPSFRGTHFTPPHPYKSRIRIREDTLSPYVFIILSTPSSMARERPISLPPQHVT